MRVIFQFKVGNNDWLCFRKNARLTSCSPCVTKDTLARAGQNRSSRNFRKEVPPILMAVGRLHDLVTVFTFNTPPSGEFVYEREQNDGVSSPRPLRRARRSRPSNVTFSATRAELDLRASLDGRLLSDTLEAIPKKNSRGDCCKSRRRSASARASKALLLSADNGCETAPDLV